MVESEHLNNKQIAQLSLEELQKEYSKLSRDYRKLSEDVMRLETLFLKANDAIFLMDNETFIDCNEKTLEMFACKRDEIVGHPPYEFSPEFQPDGQESKLKAIEKITSSLSGQQQYFYWMHNRLNEI